MSKCYFDNNLQIGYPCEYSIDENVIKVNVEYDVSEEIEAVDGVKVWSSETKFEERDIMIVDENNKQSFLMKSSYYCGLNNRLGTLDDKVVTSFATGEYFVSNNHRRLCDLVEKPMVNAIKVYSKVITECYGHPSVEMSKNEEEVKILLSKIQKTQSAEICKNNICSIVIEDDWHYSSDNSSISIEMEGCLGIVFSSAVKYDSIYKYIYELMVYIQLYYPGKFKIDKIYLKINNEDYQFVTNAVRPI